MTFVSAFSPLVAKDTVHRCWLEIDLRALRKNWRTIRGFLPKNVRCFSVLKANAYGHGLVPVAQHIQDLIDGFAVANVTEGSLLRSVNNQKPILVLSPILPNERHYILDYKLTPVISSQEEIDHFNRIAQQHNRVLDVHLKIDTGMGRTGVWHENALDLYHYLQQHQAMRCVGFLTHFSSAQEDIAFTVNQRSLFERILKAIQPNTELLIHADNSPGLNTFPARGPYNAVRVGRLQFGVRPAVPLEWERNLRIVPALSFHSRVALIKNLPQRVSVSYNRTHYLQRDSCIAVLSAGYDEGISTSAGNKAQVLIRGKRCPIIGQVTMDQTIVDITDLPSASIGDVATFIGQQGGEAITLHEWSQWNGNILSESLCSFSSPRIARVYMGEE